MKKVKKLEIEMKMIIKNIDATRLRFSKYCRLQRRNMYAKRDAGIWL